ncbi:MAG: hypothetical protein LBT04_09600 [Prevotellaceae bacterium]|jgi:hypothetical protein|nr:hypothetical protein [Prevotellaceae bacterium]
MALLSAQTMALLPEMEQLILRLHLFILMLQEVNRGAPKLTCPDAISAELIIQKLMFGIGKINIKDMSMLIQHIKEQVIVERFAGKIL